MSPATVLSFPSKALVRSRGDREFLPAALEIIETPASPVGRATALTIVVAVIFAVAWACIGRVDIIATAPGRIVPIGRSKTVQPLEAGIVRAIRVDDGDHVHAGEALIELDSTQARADRVRLARELLQAELDRARLEGLRQVWHKGSAPALVDPPKAVTPTQLETAIATMRAQVAEQAAKLADLDQQIVEKHAQGTEATATLAKLRASLPLVAQEAELRHQVMVMQWGNKIAWFEAQQRLVEQQHELAVVAGQQEEAAAAATALERQREEARAEYEKGVLTDLAKAETQASEARQELIKATQKAQLRTLRAPIDGTVQQLAVHTVGGVVTPAEPLLMVVPDNPGLVVEARVANKDIGFVHVGQKAEIKVEAFTFTRYGLIHGTVLEVSRDAVEDDPAKPAAAPKSKDAETGDDHTQHSTRSPGYVARIALGRTAMATENGPVALEPGMAVTAEIKTGRRRVIGYLLSPLMRYRQEGFRER